MIVSKRCQPLPTAKAAHRGLLLDDSRGVAEDLNETLCVQDKFTGLTVSTDKINRVQGGDDSLQAHSVSPSLRSHIPRIITGGRGQGTFRSGKCGNEEAFPMKEGRMEKHLR
ncbi:hypothetical protein F2Q68_00022804 [Brassica cretica]|uniref:Uncharacterized protein n=1 Tax=Brassica cretica TaxID=69181 RepID=A0A8S9G090_BRACR|nr:hypothetical protein F2Q68_00022804 [Brassica cretica]